MRARANFEGERTKTRMGVNAFSSREPICLILAMQSIVHRSCIDLNPSLPLTWLDRRNDADLSR